MHVRNIFKLHFYLFQKSISKKCVRGVHKPLQVFTNCNNQANKNYLLKSNCINLLSSETTFLIDIPIYTNKTSFFYKFNFFFFV